MIQLAWSLVIAASAISLSWAAIVSILTELSYKANEFYQNCGYLLSHGSIDLFQTQQQKLDVRKMFLKKLEMRL